MREANQIAVEDRREPARRRVRYLRCYSPVPGTIIDLSDRGMCVETVAEILAGSEYTFRIRHSSLLFSLRAEVKWSRYLSTLSESAGKSLCFFRAGVEFSQNSPDRELAALLKELISESSRPLLSVRDSEKLRLSEIARLE